MRLVVWLALLLLPLCAKAQPPLQFRHLGLSDGLSSSVVTAVEVDARGFIWFGSMGAADRYDGARLRPFALGPGVDDAYTFALAESSDGTVWAGGADGLWRRLPRAADFRRVRLGSLADMSVRALEAGEETLWVGTLGDGLLRIEGGRVRRYTARGGHLASDTVRAVVRLASGGVAVATVGGVTRIEQGRVRVDRSVEDATTLAEAGGRVWAGRQSGEVVGLGPGGVRLGGGGAPVSALAPSGVRPDEVWVGYRGGGVRVLDARAGTLAPMPLAEGLPEPFDRVEVLSLVERNGVLWVGTTRGVYHAAVGRPRFTAFRSGPGEPLAVPDVVSVHVSRRDSSTVWAGTIQGGLHRIDRQTGQAERWFDAPHPLAVVFAIQEVADGSVWLGGRGATLWRFRPETGQAEPLPLASDRGGLVADLTPSRRYPGQLWVSTSEAGLVRVDALSGRVVRRYDSVEGADRIPADNVWQVVEAEGVLWVATARLGLWRLDLGTGRAERVAPDCPMGDVLLSLAVAPGGALWIGGRDNQLVRYDRETGACRVYTPDDGLLPEAVGGLFTDASGTVWMSTNLGLVRFDPKAEVFTPFTAADGLASTELYWYARDQSPSGEIAVGGAGGLTVFDPARIGVDDTPSPVVLTGVVVDGVERPMPAGDLALDLRHRENDVAFRYAALDLRQSGQTRYRVRLLGASEAWAAAGPETRYPALAPGRYTFEVTATNRDGYWSPTLRVPVRVRPPFWQTVPFWLLIASLLGSLGYAGHRYRIAQIHRIEQTRRRIADDLHDGIGSKISSVALRLDMVGRTVAMPESARETLATLSSTARSVVGDLRDTVWLVDADHDDLASVVSRMEQFAVATLAGRGHVTAPAEPPPPRLLTMEARRDLYMLFTEALHNAVRHARASCVAVRIEASADRVAFDVEDDGVGFDPSEVARGRGLTTMTRRAEALGGAITWTPREGGGTIVHFETDLG